MENIFFYIIEILVIGFIIFRQIISYRDTYWQIKCTGYCIGKSGDYAINKYVVPFKDTGELTPREIMEQHVPGENPADKRNLVEIALIRLDNTTENRHPVFESIIDSINTYLLRNRGVPGFDLIKDIVERNVNNEQEQVQLSLSIPLYLGILGAMAGIIMALLRIVLFRGSNEFSTGEVKFLLGGVAIAMTASAAGILFTTLNSRFLKKENLRLETCRNGFYNTIQTELLPQISTDLTSSLVTLQRNLDSFNLKFEGNLNRIEGMFGANIKSLELQKEVLEKVERTDLSRMVQANTSLFAEIGKNIGEFSKFREYLEQVNSFVGNAEELKDQLMELIIKIGEYDEFRESIRKNFASANELYDYLTRHFKRLDDDNTRMKKAVANVEDDLLKTLEELRRHTAARMNEVTKLTINQEDILKNAFDDQVKTIKNVSAKQNSTLESHFSQFRDKILKDLSMDNLKDIFGKLDKTIEIFGEDTSKIQTLFEEQQNSSREFNDRVFNDFSTRIEKINVYMEQNKEILTSINNSLSGRKIDIGVPGKEKNRPVPLEIKDKNLVKEETKKSFWDVFSFKLKP